MEDTATKKTTITTEATEDKNNTQADKATSGEKAEKSDSIKYIIYFLFGLLEILLIFRLVFKITGANPVSSFASLIYSLTQIFILPFSGIFPQASTSGIVTTAVFEPATLVAIVVYALLGWGFTQIAKILSGRQQ